MIKKYYNEIIFFFDQYDKRSLFILFVLFIITGIIELLGIASIVPFVGLITDPNYLLDNQLFNKISIALNISGNELIIFSGIMIISLFILSNIMSAFTLWKTVKYTAYQSQKISVNVYNKYLSQPYGFFVNNNLSSISRNILDISVSLSESVFLPLLQIMSRTIVMIFISILLISVNPVIFIFSLFIMVVLYVLIFKQIKQRLKIYGEERLEANDKRFKNVNECLHSIKDIKFYNTENFYSTGFSDAQKTFLNLTATSTLLTTLPRYLIEIFAFGGFFSIILYIIYLDNNLTTHLPTIALFILAAYRMLPSMQQIFAFTGSIRFNYPALEVVRKIYRLNCGEKTSANLSNMSADIEFKNVSFSYGNKINTLKDISFTIEKHSLNAIIGSTGAGKTTLVDLLLGLYNPSSGEITINVRNYNQNINMVTMGYVPQNVSFINDTIVKNIAFGINDNEIDYELINKILSDVELAAHIKSLKDGYDTFIGDKGAKLSGGQLQRLGIARALYFKPTILILDEATNALDLDTEQKIIKSLNLYKKDMTIILVTHRPSAIKLCDNIYHLTNKDMKKLSLNNREDIATTISNIIKLNNTANEPQ